MANATECSTTAMKVETHAHTVSVLEATVIPIVLACYGSVATCTIAVVRTRLLNVPLDSAL